MTTQAPRKLTRSRGLGRIDHVPRQRACKPFRVPRSKRMSTGWHGVGAEALGNEVENGRDLLARDVELLDDLADAQVLEVLNDRGNGQTSAFEHPGATHLARDALDGRAVGPVKGCHCSDSCSRLRQNAAAV